MVVYGYGAVVVGEACAVEGELISRESPAVSWVFSDRVAVDGD